MDITKKALSLVLPYLDFKERCIVATKICKDINYDYMAAWEVVKVYDVTWLQGLSKGLREMIKKYTKIMRMNMYEYDDVMEKNLILHVDTILIVPDLYIPRHIETIYANNVYLWYPHFKNDLPGIVCNKLTIKWNRSYECNYYYEVELPRYLYVKEIIKFEKLMFTKGRSRFFGASLLLCLDFSKLISMPIKQLIADSYIFVETLTHFRDLQEIYVEALQRDSGEIPKNIRRITFLMPISPNHPYHYLDMQRFERGSHPNKTWTRYERN
jgi:hypothetical protein